MIQLFFPFPVALPNTCCLVSKTATGRGNIFIKERYEEIYVITHFNLYGGFNELW